tara:strand:+ start:205 stop:564 length:360 start_codon:yes stop_codon:yes gene_type:complete
MFNSPEPTPQPSKPSPPDHSHLSHLSKAKDKINALKAGEELTLDIDPKCYNEVWLSYENERRNFRQGGLQKLSMEYNDLSGKMSVKNTEPIAPTPTPTPTPTPNPVKPDPPVFPKPDER